jgi:hypothetical protein
MDAVTFATIVGLLSEFVSHRRADTTATHEEFLAWLAEGRHEEVISLLRTTSAATIGTKALLNETREVLLSRLGVLDRALAQYAGAVQGFGALARAIAPTSVLSEQCVSILRQIDASGASKVLELALDEGLALMYLDGNIQGALEIADSRFLEDDLRTLTALGLLRPDVNASGGRFFHFTRSAASLVGAD